MAYPTSNSTFTGSGNHGLQVGHNPGNIEAHFHQPERPETPPSPSLFVPFRRDPEFVDRGTLLDQIRDKCSGPASRIALVGLGGVGKSQLAIEHCYRTIDRTPETWVFWVHASNTARLEQSYRDIADQVKLPGRKEPQTDIFKLVHEWLRNEKNGRWLLVLDNADDAAVLSQPSGNSRRDGTPQHHLLTYLPPSKNSSVLMTTRTRSVALRLAEEGDIIPIEPMNETGAQALLHGKLGDGINKDGTAELAAALEFMPLALVQAAAYIRKRAPRCSVRQYLEEFRRSDKRKTSLLNYDGGYFRRDWEAKNSIIVTWQISFDHILHTKPSAAELLSLMSFFDRQGIPEALLRNRNTAGGRHGTFSAKTEDACTEEGDVEEHDIEEDDSEESVSESSLDDQFEECLDTLRDYSFISITTDVSTFEMHGLVQLATRKWLERQGQLEQWRQQYITNLCSEFPTGQYENWEKCQALFPHATSALVQRPKSEDSLDEWALLLFNAASYACKKGNMDEAEKMSTMSVEANIELFGKEHPDTLIGMSLLASTYGEQGRLGESEKLNIQVLETRKKILGPEHPSTLISMSNLALTYSKQGRLKESEKLNIQVLETRKRVLGPEHPDTLTSMSLLAETYSEQGRLEESEKLNIQVLETRKKILGPEHPSTLISMSNLALIYQYQGQLEESEKLNMQVIETRKRVLGPEHPDTLTSMGNLASTYRSQERLKEAEALEVQVMEARK